MMSHEDLWLWTYWNEAKILTSFRAFSFSLTLSFPIFTYKKIAEVSWFITTSQINAIPFSMHRSTNLHFFSLCIPQNMLRHLKTMKQGLSIIANFSASLTNFGQYYEVFHSRENTRAIFIATFHISCSPCHLFLTQINKQDNIMPLLAIFECFC